MLKDVLKDKQTYVDGSLKVYVKDYNTEGENYTLGTLEGLTWGALTSPEGYTFPAGSDKVYKIEYTVNSDPQTEVSEKRENEAIVTPDGGADIHYTGVVNIGVVGDFIKKEWVKTEGNTISWKSTLTIPKVGLKNLQYEDIAKYGLTVIPETIKIFQADGDH